MLSNSLVKGVAADLSVISANGACQYGIRVFYYSFNYQCASDSCQFLLDYLNDLPRIVKNGMKNDCWSSHIFVT